VGETVAGPVAGLVTETVTPHSWRGHPGLSFAEFDAHGDSERLYTSPKESGEGDPVANPAENLVELRGIEPLTLRLPGAFAVSAVVRSRSESMSYAA
jgi:hypothetical protein